MGNSTNGAITGLVTIVDRGRGSSLTALMNKRYSQIHILTMGVGTAGSEIMALLGLDSVEKDVIFSLVPADVLPIILTELSGKKFLKSSGKGIAFSLRLTGISSLVQAALLESGARPERKETPMETSDRYSLVLVVAEPGYTDKIVETARSAGATGGTVLYGRGVGSHESNHFLGISIQAQREIVAIVTPAKQRLEIMKAVNTQFGLRTDAKAMVLSLPVEDLIQVG